MAKEGGASQKRRKTESVDPKEDWKEVGRSLRRIAVSLETDKGQRRRGKGLSPDSRQAEEERED